SLVWSTRFFRFSSSTFWHGAGTCRTRSSTLFTFQDIAEYTGPLGGSRPRHHGTELRSVDSAEDTFVAIAALAIAAPPARRKICGRRDSPTERWRRGSF